LVARAHGDWAAAAQQFAAARDLFEAIGQPYDAAHSLEALADVAARAEPPLAGHDAAALANQARLLYERLGVRSPGEMATLSAGAALKVPAQSTAKG
ncbi:MAG: hypothetical protein ACRDI2_23450, partial [Chloroflexota bacterium]